MDLVSLDGYMEDVVIEKDHLNQVSHFYQNLTTPNGSEGRVDFTDAGSPPRRFYLTDHLGSTRAVINGSGTVMEGYLYTAYGEMESLMETVEDSKERFSGKEFDREGAVDGVTGGIGLNYFGARYYDAAVGYWTSRDPMNQFWSGYSYVGNGRNPLSSVDPDGNENLLVFYQNQQRLSQWAEENREVANQTALTTTDIGVGFIPVVGDVKDWQEVATGKNLLTGENLSAGQRLLTAGAGLLPAVGGALVRKVFGGLADLLRGGRKATKEAVETAAESGTKKVAKQSNVNVAGKKVTEPDGGFSADLSKTKAKTRSGHRNAGNKQLNEKMKNDPQFRSEMESRHGTDVLDRTSTSNGGRRNPSNTEWDHNTQNPNQLDLRTKPNHAKKTKTEGRSGGGWKKFHKD